MANKTASEKMRIIHDTKRPMMSDYINELFDDFVELHGDRYFADDHAIMAGIGYFNGIPVTVIGHRKGRTIEQNMDANFGMANPEGYRKALRLAHQAEKFHRPVINFVDTSGARTRAGRGDRPLPVRVYRTAHAGRLDRYRRGRLGRRAGAGCG